jgi:hypothetical protein
LTVSPDTSRRLSRQIAHHDGAAVYGARHPETVHFPVSDHAGTLSGVSLTAGVLEFVGGILLVLGLFTKPVAFLLSGPDGDRLFHGAHAA